MGAKPEEGEACWREGCSGHYVYVKDGDCSCHVSPPCWACTEAYLECGTCGHPWEGE